MVTMPTTPSVRAVIFDLGDTLWFHARQAPLGDLLPFQAEAVGPLIEAWSLVIPIPLLRLLEEIWLAGDEADRTREYGHLREMDLAFIARGALSAYGVEITPEQAEAWHRAAWIPARHFGVQLYPDTLDVLCELRARGICIAINSNRPCTGEMMNTDVDDFGMTPYIDAVVCSGDTGFVKPHPSTFEVVIEKLGLPADEMVMVGDSCERDCVPAHQLGMTTVLKLNGRYGEKPCAGADYTIHDLAELLALPIFGADRHVAGAESLMPHEGGNAGRY